MEQKTILLFTESSCSNTLIKAIEQYNNFKKIYNNIHLLLILLDKSNYGVEIDTNDKNIHTLYLNIDDIYKSTIVRNLYNKYCNEEIFSIILNTLFQEIQKSEYVNIDYIIYYTHLKPDSMLPFNKIIQIVNKNLDFDIICSNDMSYYNFINAYRSEKVPAGIEIYGKHWELELKNQIYAEIKNTPNEYIPILSGFGKISIINIKSIKDIQCSCIPGYYLDYHYRNNCNDIIISTQHTLNDTLLGMFIFENSCVFYKYTQCVNYPIVHPFVNLCFNIREKKKNTNIYICKTLLLE